jgi:hypothetical protein
MTSKDYEVFMRRVLNLLTAGLLLFHVVAEYGAHHSHSAAAIEPIASACCPATAQSSHSAPCRHHHGAGHGSCQESQCVFVRGKTRHDGERSRDAGSAVEFVAARNRGMPPSVTCYPRGFGEITPKHVPLHIQLQVLLV